MIANYHTHTNRSGHAGPEADEEYIKRAIEMGFTIFGFADHTPWPYASGYTNPHIRMLVEQLPEYIHSLRQLQKQYWDQIHVYVGLECEFFPEYIPWLTEIKDQLDFLILGSHWAPSDEHGELYYSRATLPAHIKEYTEYTLQGMQTGLFRYLAHPDHVFSDYPVFDSYCIDASYALCRKAKELDMPLEYNTSGYRKKFSGKQKGVGFPCDAFWQIAAEVGCKTIIGLDAHRPTELCVPEYISMAESTLDTLGLSRLDVLEGLG